MKKGKIYNITIRCLLVIVLLLSSLSLKAQIRGVITDAVTGDTIMFPSASYKGHKIAVSGNALGEYSIAKHVGWPLTFSAVGYQSRTIMIKQSTSNELNIKLRPDTRQLSEVVVKQKRGKYSRKNNPAVELMQRVIAAKKHTKLERHDFYEYNKYQKITLSINDLQAADLDSGYIGKRQWLLNQVEASPYNNKMILPLSVDETVTQHIYRREPRAEKDIIIGQNTTGINQIMETGDILNTLLKDVFTDVDIYDNEVRLLQFPFLSPIADGAVSFYRYYIVDTVKVNDRDCYHLQFTPNNQQDFGFSGEIYILADSTLHPIKCELTIPSRSDVNFIETLRVLQEYEQLPNGEWVLKVDDMVAELKINKLFSRLLVVRNTRIDDYSFEPLVAKLFKGRAATRKEADAMMRDEDFWKRYRRVELTNSESKMDDFITNLQNVKGFKYIIFGLRAVIENFVETGTKSTPSKVDIGPINTILTSNFIDGLRTRLSAQTTANFNKHLFLSGYIARGWSSKKTYYKGEITYAFNAKEYLPREFPKRNITFTSTYDIMSPSDKFMPTDKDNVFTAFKWTTVDKMMFYNRQQLTFEREEDWGLRTFFSLKTEKNVAAGSLFYTSLNNFGRYINLDGIDVSKLMNNGSIRTTELRFDIELSPGRTYINTKQRRLPINLDAPVFRLSHAMGLKGVLGGEYRYNFTEASVYKRFWLGSWGNIDTYINAGAQWNKVPYPLLIMPAANLSYIVEEGTFNLINNMEFLNDRYASLDVSWNLQGKLFNRIPFVRRLKWREYIGFKSLWGSLTDKNNPTLQQNAGDNLLMYFPTTSHVMDRKRPYMEFVVGVHNIFKLLHVEYVRRLNYNDLSTAHKNGVRLMLRVTF